MKIKKVLVLASTSLLCFPSVFFPVMSTSIPVSAIENSAELPKVPELLDPLANTTETKAPTFSFEESQEPNMAGKLFDLVLHASQEVSEFVVDLPKGVSMVENERPADINLTNTEGNQWHVQTDSPQMNFSIPLVVEKEGEYEVSIGESKTMLNIQAEDSQQSSDQDVISSEEKETEKRANKDNLIFNIKENVITSLSGKWFEIEINTNEVINCYRIILPGDAEFSIQNSEVEELKTVSDGSKIWIVKPEVASNKYNIHLKFYESGQFSVEDSGGEIHSDFLHVDIENQSKEKQSKVPQNRSNVNVATWAAFVAAWNAPARSQITLTSNINSPVNVLATQLRTRTTPVNITSRDSLTNALTVTYTGSGLISLESTSDITFVGAAVSNFGLSGNFVAVDLRSRLNLTSNSEVRTLVIRGDEHPNTFGPKLTIADSRLDVDLLMLSGSNGSIVTNRTIYTGKLVVTGAYSIRNTIGNQAIEVSNIDIANGLMSWNLNNTTNIADKAWEGLKSEIRNNNVISTSDNTFNNDTFNISQSSWISSYGTTFGGIPPEPEEGTVTVNYLNKQGQQLKESEIITGKVGEQYTASLPEISGYYLLNRPDAVTGTIQKDPQIVNVDYVQIHDKLINPDFEEPYIESSAAMIHQSEVPGWYTTASDKMIEFGLGPSHNIAGAAKGRQFVELNANEPGELYQIVNYEPGTVLRWRLYHAGRLGVDKMRLNIGHPEKPEVIKEMESPSRNWSLYNGTYIVPNNQELTYFGFEAVSSSGGNITLGNLLDDIHFAKQSELVVLNKVDKEEAPAGGMLNYSMHIENEGGVPADRLTISIIGLENTKIDTETIKINGQKLEETKFSFKDDRLILRPDVVINSNESIELSFDTKINSNFISGQIATHAEVDYWDEHFEDVSYSSQSNSEITEISTPVPNPLDPLNPEEEVNPENPPLLPDNQGLLSIDFVSQFDFGQQLISLSEQTYFAKPQRLLNEDGTINEQEERSNYVQISDRRPESERNGWELAVTQKEQFKGKENQVLKGASISLLNQQVVTVQGGTVPGLQSAPCDLVPGNRRTLLKAQGNEGVGTWIYRFGNAETAEKSVALNVPRGANPEATNYSTKLTWELSAVPDN